MGIVPGRATGSWYNARQNEQHIRSVHLVFDCRLHPCLDGRRPELLVGRPRACHARVSAPGHHYDLADRPVRRVLRNAGRGGHLPPTRHVEQPGAYLAPAVHEPPGGPAPVAPGSACRLVGFLPCGAHRPESGRQRQLLAGLLAVARRPDPAPRLVRTAPWMGQATSGHDQTHVVPHPAVRSRCHRPGGGRQPDPARRQA